jgi:adenylate cyclase
VLLLHFTPRIPFISAVWSGEQRFEDFLQSDGRKTATRSDFVFLGINQGTLNVGGLPALTAPPHQVFPPDELTANWALQLMSEHPFPWSREVWAILLDRLFASGARLVMFDFVFNSPRDGDPQFAAALARYRDKVVLAVNFDAANAMQPVGPNAALIPPPSLADQRVGYVNFFPDLIDHKVRSIYYSLTERQIAGQPPQPGDEVFYSISARALEQIGRGADVPLDHEAHMIRFSSNDAYPRLPLYEVFDRVSWHANYDDGAFFKDKIVVLGAAADPLHDLVDTPLESGRPGPKLHLEAMAAALAHQFLRATPFWVTCVLVGTAGLLAWVLVAFVRQPLFVLALLTGITIAYLVAARISYDQTGLLLVTVPVLTVFLLSGLCSLAWEAWISKETESQAQNPGLQATDAKLFS